MTLTPAQYFIKHHPDTKKYRHSSDKLNWGHAAIHRILTKLVYTGCAVGHERRIVTPLSRKTAKQDIEKQFIVENMHEAIVSREEYDLAQAAIRKTGRSPAKVSNYPLRSLIRCGNCGRCMTFLKSKKGFFCSYGRTDRNSACPTEAIYTATDIEQRITDLESMEESEPQKLQVDCFLNEPSLTYDMAHAFVDAVYVYPDGTNEICWKFRHFTEESQIATDQA